MTFPTSSRANPIGATRRELIDSETRRPRPTRGRIQATSTARARRPAKRPRGAIRASAQAVGAVVAVGLLMTTYLLPSYALDEPQAVAVETTAEDPANQGQSLTVADSSASLASDSLARDAFIITKTVPAGSPYSRIADMFSNNPNSPIQWPFLVGAPISSGFGWRDCAGCPAFHKGIDINPGLGTPIQAIADGVVTEVGANDWDYGTYVLISHEIDGQVIGSRYAHMIEGSSPLAVGDVVTVGTLVGQVGSTGISTGAHLHFEILLDGVTPTDPYAWMKAKVGS